MNDEAKNKANGDELGGAPTPAKLPLFVGYRKVITGLVFHASTSWLVFKGTIPAAVYGDITIALVLALLGSNVLAKFANVMENKRYGPDKPK